jgi:hypothetical protein
LRRSGYVHYTYLPYIPHWVYQKIWTPSQEGILADVVGKKKKKKTGDKMKMFRKKEKEERSVK